MSLLLHINGWPGTGKLTIARILATRLHARLLDNHTLLNPAEALFDRGDPLHGVLRQKIRDLTFQYAAQISPSTPLIFTDALSNDAHDCVMFEQCRTLAEVRGTRLVSVVLDCELEENIRRLVEAGRAEQRKLTRVEILSDLRSRYALLRPVDAQLVELDVTTLDPVQTAEAILASCQT